MLQELLVLAFRRFYPDDWFATSWMWRPFGHQGSTARTHGRVDSSDPAQFRGARSHHLFEAMSPSICPAFTLHLRRPLRSPQFPSGLPELTGKDKARVDKDNSACSFVLTVIEELIYCGGGSVRENPFNSLHWHYPQEVAMWESGFWQDWRYAACCFGGARNKSQRIRHNIEEFNHIPRAECHHIHSDREWEPWIDEHGVTVYIHPKRRPSTQQSSAS